MKQTVCFMILLMMAFGSGCTSDSPDIKAAKETIRQYDQLIAEGYAGLDMTPLKRVAADEEYTRVFHHMIAMKEAKLRLESKLKKISYIEVMVKDKTTIVVKVREVWDFRQISLQTGKPESEAKDVLHILSYEVVKQGTRWLVKRVTPLEGK